MENFWRAVPLCVDEWGRGGEWAPLRATERTSCGRWATGASGGGSDVEVLSPSLRVTCAAP